MSRRILGSLLAIMAVLALTAGTFAAFTSARNATTSLETGSIELAFNAPEEVSIHVEGIQPGYNSTRNIQLTNAGSLTGELTAEVVLVNDEEVGADCTAAEKQAGDVTCTPGGSTLNGELREQVTIKIDGQDLGTVDDAANGTPVP